MSVEMAAGLRVIAEDRDLLWTVARKAIEDELVEWRDAGRFVLRNNGFTIKFEDGTPNSIIRFGPEHGVRIALLALADHLEATS
jgi:hypothetical protein